MSNAIENCIVLPLELTCEEESVPLSKYNALYELAACALKLLESGRPTGGTRWVLDGYGAKSRVKDLLKNAILFDQEEGFLDEVPEG